MCKAYSHSATVIWLAHDTKLVGYPKEMENDKETRKPNIE